MGILLDGGLDTQRQSRGGTRDRESGNDAQSRVAPGWNLVLSYGDLSHQTGYRTRVLGELQHLDSAGGLDPFLLLFDRNPEKFEMTGGVAHAAVPRSEFARFFMEADAIARKNPIRVVHAHNLYSATLALAARPLYGYKVVFDCHARAPEEYPFTGKGGDGVRRALTVLEEWAIKSADHLIVASRALGRYVLKQYGIPVSKLSVIPCCADASLFRVDPELRDRTRIELGLSDRLICTHLGSFFEWTESEQLVRTFHNLRERYPAAHLLTVTPGEEAARGFLARHLPEGTFTVTAATHERVPALLNATDLGFLLLRNSPNIETSSPAKFAEYLNCGVPVIIASSVGDFSSLVRNRKLGEVFFPSGDSIVSDKLVQAVLHSRGAIAERCVQGGRELTWQFHRDTAKYVF
jgi:glycosyltransferase involved in cell wall biosynthesis